jgi:hypothetical protein
MYTPPSLPGAHTVVATSLVDSTKSAAASVAITNIAGVFTYHNDLARTGQNLQEYALSPAAVSGGSFGRLWSCPVDGEIHAQPLYIAKNTLTGGAHNVLVVVTQHNSIYAFDADSESCNVLWHKSFLSTGVTSIPAADIAGCTDIHTEFGITGTPVIDPTALTIYLVAATKESGVYVQRLHALSLVDGTEKSGSPVKINATIAGSGGATVSFDALQENQRPALALSGGGVFVGWAAHCDVWPYWGWLMRYDATSLTQTAVFNVAPNGNAGGIWMSGGAPTFDANGALYLSTGNGSFDLFTSGPPPIFPFNDYSMSFLNLNPTNLAVQDYYTPSQEAVWSNLDQDISSAGVVVLPDGAGPNGHPNVLVGADKGGHLWLLDRSSLGGYSASGDNVLQLLSMPGTTSFHGVFSTPAYFNGTVYVGGVANGLLAVPLTNGLLSANAQVVAPSSSSTETYTFPGSTPSISASPSGNALVWILDTTAFNASPGPGAAVLRAYDAKNLGTTLYSSAILPSDAAGYAIKFTLPVVANGHVYVGGGDRITVYGLAP